MKTIRAFLAFAFVAFAPGMGNAEDKPKKTEVLLIEVEPSALAKEFKDDATAAKKKYDPKPVPPNTAGGAIIAISGAVEVKGGKVYFQTPGAVKILLSGTKAPKEGKWAGVMKAAKFKGFRNNTITLEGDVKYEPFVGKK